MPVKTTYYGSDEMKQLEELAEETDESFSGLVREAIQSYYDL